MSAILYEINIVFHTLVAILAVFTGTFILSHTKGDTTHKRTGRFWLALMALVIASSFFIREIHPTGGISWLHWLSISITIALLSGLMLIRIGKIHAHKIIMICSYLALIVIGIFAIMPNR